MKVSCVDIETCQGAVIEGCDGCNRTLCRRCYITWCEYNGSEHQVCQKAHTEGWFKSEEEVPTLEAE